MIVDTAHESPTVRCAVITYTNNNVAEIRAKAYERIRFVPQNLTISSWYTFLLHHLVRPYQNCLCSRRVSRICFVKGISARGSRASDIRRHYFAQPGHIYGDKVSKFACEVISRTGGRPLARLAQMFDRIYIDESQDLAGFDLNLVELLLKSPISIILVGDHRQATFATNRALKNKHFAGANVIEKFKEWHKAGFCNLEYQNYSYRCTQAICDFADLLHPNLPRTESKNSRSTDHDGVFAVRRTDVPRYLATFSPQVLRYSRKQHDIPGSPISFGSAKGMTFDRTLIFPHKALEKYLMTGNLRDAGTDLPRIYVAVTRAKQSTAFVIEDGATPASVPVFGFSSADVAR